MQAGEGVLVAVVVVVVVVVEGQGGILPCPRRRPHSGHIDQ